MHNAVIATGTAYGPAGSDDGAGRTTTYSRADRQARTLYPLPPLPLPSLSPFLIHWMMLLSFFFRITCSIIFSLSGNRPETPPVCQPLEKFFSPIRWYPQILSDPKKLPYFSSFIRKKRGGAGAKKIYFCGQKRT